jgi:Bacterial PH domain
MSSQSDNRNPDFDFEPVPGLPDNLPKGEQLLWQGSPDPKAFALEAMHLRSVGAGFAVLTLWRAAAGWHDREPLAAIASTIGGTLLFAAVALAILAVSGVLMARGTVYSLTSRRLVIRHGVAMPMAINIPFSRIDSAALAESADGLGSLAFMPHARSRASYVALWPHARPWQVVRPEPLLRCIPDAAGVAQLAAKALANEARTAAAGSAEANARPAAAVAAISSRSEMRRATSQSVSVAITSPSKSPVLS